jgi:hypothetical protein
MQKSIFPLLIATLVFTFGGCKKDPENQIFITEDNVAAYVAGNIARDMRGLISETEDAARWASRGVNDASACSYVKDSTFSQNSATGSTPSFSFAQSYHTDIQCTGTIPTVVHFSLTHNGLWEASAAKANGNGSGAWNITDLNPLLTDFKINGDYSRSGNAVDKKGGNLSFSSDLRIKLKDVLVNKTTKILQGGTMTFTLTGASSSATDYDISGTVTILSSTSAKITINTKNYTIDLTTGAVS